MDARCVGGHSLTQLTSVAQYVAELCNVSVPAHHPYTGSSAFAPKGGPVSYTHLDVSKRQVHRAAFVIYLDETLVEDGWEDELAPGGLMLLNPKRALDDPRILGIDAAGISAAVLGRPIPNTVFLGAIPALTAAVTIEDIHAGICATMPEKLHAKNLRIVDCLLYTSRCV